jgi:hypothetical protein
MRFIGTRSLSQNVNDWLTSTGRARILHVFNNACNLINEYGQVLSIVTPRIGNGPFNLVIDHDIRFSDHLRLQSPIYNTPPKLSVGDITINSSKAQVWNPRPDWEALHSRRIDILRQLADLEHPRSTVSSLSTALAGNNVSLSVSQACQLAGLGLGLTPSGDDFIMGALYAAWIIHSYEMAEPLARAVAAASAPLTTSLSAAWLKSAGKGEAGILWHQLFDALISGGQSSIQPQITNILSIGATSGSDALAGFINTLISYAESQNNHVLPKFL